MGELVALRRRDIDLDAGTVRVTRKLAALRSHLEFGPPKSAAGVRVVTLSAAALEALRAHLAEFTAADADAPVFTGDKGALLRTGNFGGSVKWTRTVAALGMPGFPFHDLRHTGNTLAAASGASTRELMQRMGHASMRAALIYQHATTQRDKSIADALSAGIAEERDRARSGHGR
ncbi:tyrosine-type recombinase/integrase [Micromonospora sp. LZ34]